MTTRPDDTPQVHTVVDNNRTYVLADLPRSIASAGVLQITGDGLDVTIPFVDIDPSSDRTFAAYAFGEPGRYTIEVLGSDGEVRAIWPSP